MEGRCVKAFLAAGLVVAAGCGGAIPKTRYYVMDLPSSLPRAQDPAPYTVAVMLLRAPEPLEQDRIVYRPSPVELDFYEYHRWAQRPAAMVTAALVDRLRTQNLFSSVAIFDGRAKADYFIRGRVDRLEEVDSGGVAARVEISVELVDTKNSRTVWSGSGSHSSAVTVGEVKAVVTEISRGVDASLNQITAGLEQFVRSLPRPAGSS